jgi:metal-dependent amidase/aminoacylase/carboxypeptidase family protein
MVFSIGQVHAGTAGNIIPGELLFNGSFRVFNHGDGLHIREELCKIIEGAAAHVLYALEFLRRGPDTADRIYRGTLRDFYGQYFPAVAHLLD